MTIIFTKYPSKEKLCEFFYSLPQETYCTWYHYGYLPDVALNRYLEDNTSLKLSLTVDTTIASIGFLHQINREHGTCRLGLVCHPQYRGRGLTQELLKQLIVIAKRMNITTMKLSTDTKNVSAYNLFIKTGFTVEYHFTDNPTRVEMTLEL